MEASQQNPRSWQEMRQWQVELLERTTGQSLEAWNEFVRREGPATEKELRAWLAERSVTGYSQMLLVFERCGYPDFFTRSADELVRGQYADRPQLREIYDAVLALLPLLGGSGHPDAQDLRRPAHRPPLLRGHRAGDAHPGGPGTALAGRAGLSAAFGTRQQAGQRGDRQSRVALCRGR